MEPQVIVDHMLSLDKRKVSVNEEGFVELSSLPDEFFSAAEKYLITPKGNPHYGLIGQLEDEFNVKVYPGESDSFGWVTGVIESPEGRKVLAL